MRRLFAVCAGVISYLVVSSLGAPFLFGFIIAILVVVGIAALV